MRMISKMLAVSALATASMIIGASVANVTLTPVLCQQHQKKKKNLADDLYFPFEKGAIPSKSKKQCADNLYQKAQSALASTY